MSDGMEWSGGLADPNPNENVEVQEGQTGSDWLAAATMLAGPKPPNIPHTELIHEKKKDLCKAGAEGSAGHIPVQRHPEGHRQVRSDKEGSDA